MSNLIEYDVFQVIIIIFNSLTLPFLVKLIIGTINRLKKNKKPDKLTAYLLIFLFSILSVSSIASICVSGFALIKHNGYASPIHTGDISLIRSLFFSLGNLLVSLYFYKLYCLGEIPKSKKK